MNVNTNSLWEFINEDITYKLMREVRGFREFLNMDSDKYLRYEQNYIYVSWIYSSSSGLYCNLYRINNNTIENISHMSFHNNPDEYNEEHNESITHYKEYDEYGNAFVQNYAIRRTEINNNVNLSLISIDGGSQTVNMQYTIFLATQGINNILMGQSLVNILHGGTKEIIDNNKIIIEITNIPKENLLKNLLIIKTIFLFNIGTKLLLNIKMENKITVKFEDFMNTTDKTQKTLINMISQCIDKSETFENKSTLFNNNLKNLKPNENIELDNFQIKIVNYGQNVENKSNIKNLEIDLPNKNIKNMNLPNKNIDLLNKNLSKKDIEKYDFSKKLILQPKQRKLIEN